MDREPIDLCNKPENKNVAGIALVAYHKENDKTIDGFISVHHQFGAPFCSIIRGVPVAGLQNYQFA